MAERRRPIVLRFYVSEEEKELILQKMALVGTDNLGAYLRKMAIDGQVIKLDLPELREMISLLRYAGNNINQIARCANASGHVYETDLAGIHDSLNSLWNTADGILKSLSLIP